MVLLLSLGAEEDTGWTHLKQRTSKQTSHQRGDLTRVLHVLTCKTSKSSTSLNTGVIKHTFTE